MKRKPVLIVAFIALICVVALVAIFNGKENRKEKRSALYQEYMYPNEKYFGKELYQEIDHQCTEQEREVGEDMAERLRNVFAYMGPEEDADMSVGALKAFYYFPYYLDTVSCEYKADMVTTKIEGNTGHVWLVYSVTRYDKNGEIVNLSAGILTLLYIEKKDGGWEVIDSREAP